MNSSLFYTKEIDIWILQRIKTPCVKLFSIFIKTFPRLANIKESNFYQHYKKLKQRGEPLYSVPLYSERYKEGRFYIKIAYPNKWVLKNRWFYIENHPEELADLKKDDVFIFLDNDKTNYSYSNIIRMSKAESMACNRFGGFRDGDIEYNRYLIAKIRLTRGILSAADRCGLVYTYNNSRALKKNREKNMKNYREKHKDDAELLKKKRDYQKKYAASLTEERREELKKRHHEYYIKNKAEKAAQTDAQGTSRID